MTSKDCSPQLGRELTERPGRAWNRAGPVGRDEHAAAPTPLEGRRAGEQDEERSRPTDHRSGLSGELSSRLGVDPARIEAQVFLRHRARGGRSFEALDRAHLSRERFGGKGAARASRSAVSYQVRRARRRLGGGLSVKAPEGRRLRGSPRSMRSAGAGRAGPARRVRSAPRASGVGQGVQIGGITGGQAGLRAPAPRPPGRRAGPRPGKRACSRAVWRSAGRWGAPGFRRSSAPGAVGSGGGAATSACCPRGAGAGSEPCAAVSGPCAAVA